MPYKRRTRQCAKCHEDTTGRYPSTGDVLCVPCNMDVAKDAALQMANKSGPYYDEWLKTRGPQGRPRITPS